MSYVGKIFQTLVAQDKDCSGWALAISEPNADAEIELLSVCFTADSVRAQKIYLEIPASIFSRPAALNLQKKIWLKAECLGEKFHEVPDVFLEKALKGLIFLETEKYYRHIHSLDRKNFIPLKTRIPYASRVYDHREILNLVDSSLEFYLTASRYDQQFCKEFTRMISSSDLPRTFAYTTNSGSSANLLAVASLMSHRLGEDALREGDEVISVAAGFPTTVFPIIQNKLIPVFVDIESGYYNIDTSQIEEAITDKTRAIFIAHTLGIPFDLDRILEIAAKHRFWVLEDNCDALGAEYRLKGRYELLRGKVVHGKGYTGTFGHVATTSFYPAHQMTMGEGGVVYTSDAVLSRIITSLRDWGRDCWCPSGKDNTCGKRFEWKLGALPEGYDHKYVYSHIGYNLKLTDMQAAVGLAQLEKLPSFVEARRRNWCMLLEGLRDLADIFILPRCPVEAQPSPFGFTLTLREPSYFNRNSITSFLESCNIQTRTVFAGNLLRQPALTHSNVPLRIRDSALLISKNLEERHYQRLPVTENLMRNTFWVGVYPGLTEEMLVYMIKKIHESVSRYSP